MSIPRGVSPICGERKRQHLEWCIQTQESHVHEQTSNREILPLLGLRLWRPAMANSPSLKLVTISRITSRRSWVQAYAEDLEDAGMVDSQGMKRAGIFC
jgi:hypothetical protein